MENALKNKVEKIEKLFFPKDVFFNNGIVNLYEYLQKADLKQINYYGINNNSLKIQFEKKYETLIFDRIVSGFVKDNKLVVFTANDRLYWDKKRNAIVKYKKIDIPAGATNEKKYIHFREKLEQLGITKDSILLKYEQHPDKKVNKFTNLVSKTGDVIILKEFNEYVNRYKDKVLWAANEDELNVDSKIHPFEWGVGPFMDMLSNVGEKIDKWEALIYWFGTRIKRFYYFNLFFLFPNSSDLAALYEFKKELNINDEKRKIKDKKTEEEKTIPTNINFKDQLLSDGIKNVNFYISGSEEEFQLKFFMYLFSLIYHIEDRYANESDEKRKVRMENLFNSLKKITFFTYTQKDDMKSSLNEYSKAYKLTRFFEKIKREVMPSDNKNLFAYLSELITIINLSKERGELNLNIKSFSDNLLHFKSLRKNYLLTSFDILGKQKRGLGKELYDFEKMYLNEIKEEAKNMDLHDKSKIIGEGIGGFQAQLEDKNLLFTLRNIKNYKQLISYFKDFKFEVLKNQEKARFSSSFNESMVDILEYLYANPGNWEIVRDYIAIYAIDKYKSVSYAKGQNKGGN